MRVEKEKERIERQMREEGGRGKGKDRKRTIEKMETKEHRNR